MIWGRGCIFWKVNKSGRLRIWSTWWCVCKSTSTTTRLRLILHRWCKRGAASKGRSDTRRNCWRIALSRGWLIGRNSRWGGGKTTWAQTRTSRVKPNRSFYRQGVCPGTTIGAVVATIRRGRIKRWSKRAFLLHGFVLAFGQNPSCTREISKISKCNLRSRWSGGWRRRNRAMLN